jgi:hypothetical protein
MTIARGRRQQHVGLVDGAYTGVDDADLHPSVSLVSVSASTSADPCTSALMMIGSP